MFTQKATAKIIKMNISMAAAKAIVIGSISETALNPLGFSLACDNAFVAAHLEK